MFPTAHIVKLNSNQGRIKDAPHLGSRQGLGTFFIVPAHRDEIYGVFDVNVGWRQGYTPGREKSPKGMDFKNVENFNVKWRIFRPLCRKKKWKILSHVIIVLLFRICWLVNENLSLYSYRFRSTKNFILNKYLIFNNYWFTFNNCFSKHVMFCTQQNKLSLSSAILPNCLCYILNGISTLG